MKTMLIVMSVAFFFGFTLVVNAGVEHEEPVGCRNVAGETKKIQQPLVAKPVVSEFLNFEERDIVSYKAIGAPLIGVVFTVTGDILSSPNYQIQKIWTEVISHEGKVLACKKAEMVSDMPNGYMSLFREFPVEDANIRFVIQYKIPDGSIEFNGTKGAHEYNSAPKEFEFGENPEKKPAIPKTPRSKRPGADPNKKLLAAQ